MIAIYAHRKEEFGVEQKLEINDTRNIEKSNMGHILVKQNKQIRDIDEVEINLEIIADYGLWTLALKRPRRNQAKLKLRDKEQNIG